MFGNNKTTDEKIDALAEQVRNLTTGLEQFVQAQTQSQTKPEDAKPADAKPADAENKAEQSDSKAAPADKGSESQKTEQKAEPTPAPTGILPNGSGTSGLNNDSVKSMTPDQINENWKAISEGLASGAIGAESAAN